MKTIKHYDKDGRQTGTWFYPDETWDKLASGEPPKPGTLFGIPVVVDDSMEVAPSSGGIVFGPGFSQDFIEDVVEGLNEGVTP